ncbi:MAG: flavodoxin family protein [Candidatus Gastranaerophilales bacterium]|nr:flavodoxin family protein [Candidatus Gastranaerophilales bacterium]
MKKVIILNGSPRKNFNTAQLLQEAQKGAEAAGAETEYINLVDLNYKGCMSCFACKRKGVDLNGLCAWKDDLKPVLEKIVNADAVIIGSPIYYSYPTGMFRNLLERMLFAGGTYMFDENGNYMRSLKRKIPVGIIFTMNVPENLMGNYEYPTILGANEMCVNMIYGYCETLNVCDTYQFNDYSKYDCNMFSEEHKKKVKETQFPIDLERAFDLGKRLSEMNV